MTVILGDCNDRRFGALHLKLRVLICIYKDLGALHPFAQYSFSLAEHKTPKIA
jgi:hypothetical protein